MANIAQEKMNEITQKVISSIEKNETGVWSKGWIGSDMPSNYKTKTPYSGFNTISLMIMQEEMKYSSSQWLTFNQIKFIKGAKLKKGSKSTPVFFFKILEKKEIIKGKEEISKIPLLKFYYVFNTDQVENLEIGEDKPHNTDLNQFVANCNIEVKLSLSAAYYSPKKDYIGMPDLKVFDTVEGYASTLLHELTHSTGHQSRLDRDMQGEFGSDSYSYEECIAELGSLFLMNHLGIEGETKNSEAYIKSWLIKGLKAEPKLLWKIASSAQKAYAYLLEQQEQKQEAA